MTTNRARAIVVGLAALVGSTVASGCVVHDRHGYGHGHYGRGVYHATPVRRTTRYYYSSPYDRGHRVEHRRSYRYGDDDDRRHYRRERREYRYDYD